MMGTGMMIIMGTMPLRLLAYKSGKIPKREFRVRLLNVECILTYIQLFLDLYLVKWYNQIYFSVIFCFGGRKGISPCEPNQNLQDALTQIIF